MGGNMESWDISAAERKKLAETASFEVEFKLDVSAGKLTFWLDDHGNGAVHTDANGNTNLLVPKDVDRQFILTLSDKWQWIYDPNVTDPGGKNVPFRTKDSKDAKYYDVVRLNDRQMALYAKSTKANTKQVHPFNIYVVMQQEKGSPIPLRIDPGVDNPD